MKLFTKGSIIFGLICALTLCIVNPVKATNPPTHEVPKDTTSALVVYGTLLKGENSLINKEMYSYLDSILDLDYISPETMEEIAFCRSLFSKDEDELSIISDSLFRLDKIPFALINEVNGQIARGHNEIPHTSMIPHDDTPYPANCIYHSWHTTKANPYSMELSKNDSIISLLLTDSTMFCNYVFPLEKSVITSKFGWRDGRNHNGYDLDLEVWDPVKSSFAGVVRVATTVGHYGRLVVVRHYNGLETYYAHLHRFKVKTGDIVEAGDVIGLGGSSGRSTGSHLHYEIRFKGIPLDPGQLIAFKEKSLISDEIVLNKTRWSYGIIPKGVTFHHVKKGDYLHKIAQTYGQTVDNLCELNGIKRNTLLRVGQKLRVIQPD